MLQFVNSTVFLTKASTQKRIITDKKTPFKKIMLSSPDTSITTNFYQKGKISTLLTQNPSKRSIKEKLFKKHEKEPQKQRKIFQEIDNTRVLTKKQSKQSENFQKSHILFNPVHKQNILMQKSRPSVQTGQKMILQQKTIMVQKKAQRLSNTIHIQKSNNQKTTKSSFFVRRQFSRSMKKFTQQKSQIVSDRRNLSKEELYYVDELKRQIRKINLSDEEQNQRIPMIVGHFFQSVSTFYRFKELKEPEQPKVSVFLPKQRKLMKTLIFDMDETLVHAEPYQKDIHINSWGQNFDITIDDGSKVMINMKVRPFVLEVLQRLKLKFQIGVFTAANQTYAKQILAKIDPLGKIFDFKLFRQHCDVVDGKLAIKDLRILSNRLIKNVILVDNSPHTYLYQKENAIPILSFYNDLEDKEMLKLEDFIKSEGLNKREDVRKVLQSRFKLNKFTEFDSLEELLEMLCGQSF